jgi:hypothetical protein
MITEFDFSEMPTIDQMMNFSTELMEKVLMMDTSIYSDTDFEWRAWSIAEERGMVGSAEEFTEDERADAFMDMYPDGPPAGMSEVDFFQQMDCYVKG